MIPEGGVKPSAAGTIDIPIDTERGQASFVIVCRAADVEGGLLATLDCISSPDFGLHADDMPNLLEWLIESVRTEVAEALTRNAADNRARLGLPA